MSEIREDEDGLYDTSAWDEWPLELRKLLHYCTECLSYSEGTGDCEECHNGKLKWTHMYCGECEFYSGRDSAHFLDYKCCKCKEFEILGITWAFLHKILSYPAPPQTRIAAVQIARM